MFLEGNKNITKKLNTEFYNFRHEDKNASWEAVKILPPEIKVQDIKFSIEKIKVQVIYDDVDKEIDKIWSKKPFLVIHVGVSGFVSKINIEKCATNGFCQPDYSNTTLCNANINLENSGTCEILHTKIDVDSIVNSLNKNYKNIFTESCDVGKYLCGYIYLKSLDKDSSKVIFIHVPPIDKPLSSRETSDGIFKIIEKTLLQLLN